MSTRKRLIAILSVTLAFVFVPAGWGADAWPPVSAAEMQMTAEPKAPGAPAIFLYRQVDRDDTSGRETNLARIKILTEDGRKYADVELPFVKGISQVRNIKARTIQPDGAMTEFNGKIYEQTVVKAKGVKFLAKTFTLPDVRVGTIIDYSYTVEMNSGYVYDSRWIISEELFTKHAKFSLKPSNDFALQWRWPSGLPPGTKAPVKEGAYIRLESSDIPAFQVEDFMPPENTVKFRVEFAYAFAFETDPVKFWQKYDKDWYSAFENFTNKRKAMEQAVSQIVSAGDAPDIKLQKIYARVLQIRNTSFERDKTEQEEKRSKEKDTNNVEDVWKRGYGDSVAINWLFIALAKAAGIEAYSVRVSSRASYFFDQRLMNGRQLNTDVVLVKQSGKDLYLDPGAKFAPFGLLPWYETQVQGLLLGKDGGQWVVTALTESAAAKTERKADLTLSEDGTLEGKLTVTFGGLEALELRTEERDEDDTSRKTALEDMVKESVPVGAEIELTNKPDWAVASPTLVAEYHVKVPGWVSGAGRRALFPVGLFSNSEKHLFEHAERVYSVYFHHPYLKSDDLSITLPLGWKISSLPAPVNQDAKAVAYILKSEDVKGTLHIARILRSDLGMVKQDQFGILRQFFQFVRNGDEQQVVLQPAS